MRRAGFPVFLLLFGLAAWPTLSAGAQPHGVEAILAQVRQHGYDSPATVIRKLEAAPDRPGQNASPEARRVYYGTLGFMAVLAEDTATYQRSVEALGSRAKPNACSACAAQQSILRAQWELSHVGVSGTLELLAKAHSLLGQHPSTDLKIRFLATRASAYRQANEVDRSIKDAIAAYQLAAGIGDVATQIDMVVQLAVDNATLRDLTRADSQIDEAISRTKRIGYGYQLANAYLSLGYIRALEGRRDQQREAFLTAYKLSHGRTGLSGIEAITLSNLADYYLTRNENATALDYARRAVALTRQIDQKRILSAATINVGIAMSRLGQIDAGIAKVKEAIGIAKQMNNREFVIGMSHELIKIYENAGRYREADTALHEVVGYEKALTEQQRKREVLALQEQFSAERKTREIERLSIENARQQAVVRAHNAQRWLWITTAIALALATTLLAQLWLRVRRANRGLSETNRALSEESSHDALTGVYNRRYLDAMMPAHEQKVLETPAWHDSLSVGLVMLDVDHFKQINDDYGHGGGDAVLVAITQRLRTLLRQQDALVRWGGEEFVLILPGIGSAGMRILLTKMLHTLGETPVPHNDQRIAVTISAGGTVFPMRPGQPWKEALQIADLAQYLAKASGRNRGVCAANLADGADLARLRRNLLAAEAAGDITLETILGPRTEAAECREVAAESVGTTRRANVD